MRSITRALATCATAAILTACQQPPASTPDFLGAASVGNVNGIRIPESVFRLYVLSRAQRTPDQLSSDEREAILDEVLQIYLLAGAAEEQAIDEERTMAAQIELQRLNALARTAVERYREKNEVTESELRDAYEENLDQLGAPQYKARHILVKTQPEAEAIIEELKGGGDFAELAETHSTGPTGPQGGDLGWFDANTMVAPFADAVRGMTAGTFTQAPVETRFGWHVILLEDTRENEPPGLEAVRDEMTTRVEQQKIEAYIGSLKDKAVIDVEIEGTVKDAYRSVLTTLLKKIRPSS